MMRLLFCAIASLLAPVAVSAQPITYTYTAALSGAVNGSQFSGVGTFTGVADTSSTIAFDGWPALQLDAFSLLLDGVTYDVFTPMLFFSNNEYGIAGFVAKGSEVDGFSFYSPALIDYTGVTEIAADTTSNYVSASFIVDQGILMLNGQGDGSFSATLDAGAVPEPASWALMIAGFGLLGGSMRRVRARRFAAAG